MAETIKDVAYEKYQLDWMMKHNISLNDLVEELGNAAHEMYLNNPGSGFPNLHNVFNEWESTKGFSEGIWSCKDEFIAHEYQDKAYIEALLSNNEVEEYISEEDRDL